MSRASAARAVRGAGVLEYGVLVVGIGALSLLAASTLGGENSAVAEWQGKCVKEMGCREGSLAGAKDIRIHEKSRTEMAMQGASEELGVAGEELTNALLQPSDVVAGFGYIADHPSQAMKALLHTRANSPRTSTSSYTTTPTSEGAAGATRVATSLSPAVIGRVGKIGAMLREGKSIEAWTLPPPPEAPEVVPVPEAAPAPAPPAPPTPVTVHAPVSAAPHPPSHAAPHPHVVTSATSASNAVPAPPPTGLPR